MGSDHNKPILAKTLRQITSVTDILYLEGILVARFLNHRRGMKPFTTERVDDYLSRCASSGLCRLGTELHRRVLDSFVIAKTMVKPILVIVFAAETV